MDGSGGGGGVGIPSFYSSGEFLLRAGRRNLSNWERWWMAIDYTVKEILAWYFQRRLLRDTSTDRAILIDGDMTD